MRYHFTWRVFPERCAVDIWKFSLKTEFGEIHFQCVSSQINIIFDNTSLEYYDAYLLIKTYSQTVVDSLGFRLGCSYKSEIINEQFSNSEIFVYGVQIEELNLSNYISFDKILELTLSDIYLRFSLNDYLNAINSEVECPFLCYRSIETIKSSFDPNKWEKWWNTMHSNLWTQKKDILKIKKFADPIRHWTYSKFKSTTTVQRIDFLKITQAVILKYVEHISKLRKPIQSESIL